MSENYANHYTFRKVWRSYARSDGKVYRLREAILLSKRLGIPLSQEEMNQFEMFDNKWMEQRP